MKRVKRIYLIALIASLIMTQTIYADDGDNRFKGFLDSIINTVQEVFSGNNPLTEYFTAPQVGAPSSMEDNNDSDESNDVPELNKTGDESGVDIHPIEGEGDFKWITFYGNGGQIDGHSSLSVSTNETTVNLYRTDWRDENNVSHDPKPTRSDTSDRKIVFAGWAPHGTSQIIRTQNYTIDSSIVLDAIWKTSTKDSYTVTFNPEQGAFPGYEVGAKRTKDVAAGAACTFYELPQRSGHTFMGWRIKGESTDYTAIGYVDPIVTYAYTDLEFIAVWDDSESMDTETFYVKCDANGGTFPSIEHNIFTIHYSLGVPDTVVEAPSREGFTFNGWTLDKNSTTGILTDTPRPTYPYDAAEHNTAETAYVYYAAWLSNNTGPTKTIYITWQPNGGTFGETFDYTVDDITGYASKSVVIENTGAYSVDMSTAPIVTREDFVLKGWSLSGTDVPYTGGAYNASSSVTFTAIWEEYNESDQPVDPTGSSYSVTFNANGGQFANGNTTISQMVAARGVASEPETPIYSAHVFKGWGETATATKAVNVSTLLITSNKTFYAIWGLEDEGIPTRVLLVLQGGSYDGHEGTYNIVATVGTPIKQFYNLATRSGYTLKGYATEPDTETVLPVTAVVESNMTLYAVWLRDESQVITHIVTFDGNGGTYDGGSNTVKTVQVKDGEKLTTVPTPSMTAAKFKGYSSELNGTQIVDLLNTEITSDVVYYAVWETEKADNYSVSFIAGDGYGGSKFSDGTQQKIVNVSAGSKVSSPETPLETKNLTFDYWSETKAGSWTGNSPAFDFNRAINKTTTLYAIYKNQDNSSKFRTVKFKYNGGKLRGKTSVSADVLAGRPVSKPEEPKRTGYTFKGWYTDEEGLDEDKWDFDDPVNEDLTLYAIWKEKKKDENKSNATTASASTSSNSNAAGAPTAQAATLTPDATLNPIATTQTGTHLDANGNLVDANGNLVAARSVPKTGVEASATPVVILIVLTSLLIAICLKYKYEAQ